MGHFSSMFNGLATSLSMKKAQSHGAGAGELILETSGFVSVEGSNNFTSVFSRRGEKGVNQDSCIVWEGFGCGEEDDRIFCGIFDGHGPWGHYVAKRVKKTIALSLLSNWQETLAAESSSSSIDDSEKRVCNFNIWKQSYIKTFAAIDLDLKSHKKIDTFNSGTTGLTIVRQGEEIFIANVGDSRAVLGSISDDGRLIGVQLTMDFKPHLIEETERIIECNGRVFCLDDEPGVHRVWRPDIESPGLAMSRAFGDFSIKEFGLISLPQVIQRRITINDQFIILATDGVWDVVSNQEAVEIVSSTADKSKAAKRLTKFAANAWKRKRRGFAVDDISAICVFLHSSSAISTLSSHLVHPV
ncbi:probable protein phosphatase 2C 73 isoform X1 [Impatiens glandulifera]|uniref:probable protein phosphatase 2C 73 isoform X1 n=1 Tax=Impatiens glandulifera TaxID=253017 RepID=UPI001FB0D6A1|nr:probable protein phosphatase 2C 73 isoform X1 [Impatiens glandulifera]XP_047327495.1 probable protein phosphatase 2C 73 isoform X1 [Impatiens glandulifera]